MKDILGHDCIGRPLRSGDQVVAVYDPSHWFFGAQCEVVGTHDQSVGDLHVRSDGKDWAVYGYQVRKIDNHQSAGSFDEVMAGLKAKPAQPILAQNCRCATVKIKGIE